MKTQELMHFDRHVDLDESGGVYFGDPGLVIPDGFGPDRYTARDDLWATYCDSLIRIIGKGKILVTEYEKLKFYSWDTASASGSEGAYPLRCNHNTMAVLEVDAGVLSVIPIKLLKLWGTLEQAKQAGFVYTGPDLYGEMSVENGDFTWNIFDIKTKRTK